MNLELRPPTDAAGVTLGASRADATRQCQALGDPEDFRRGDERHPSLVAHRPSGLAVFVYFDDQDDVVEAVELGRPAATDDVVTYDGVDVFATPADDLVERLRGSERVEVTEEGRWFEAVLVARPGYR